MMLGQCGEIACAGFYAFDFFAVSLCPFPSSKRFNSSINAKNFFGSCSFVISSQTFLDCNSHMQPSGIVKVLSGGMITTIIR